jgi:hypothetical protein
MDISRFYLETEKAIDPINPVNPVQTEKLQLSQPTNSYDAPVFNSRGLIYLIAAVAPGRA